VYIGCTFFNEEHSICDWSRWSEVNGIDENVTLECKDGDCWEVKDDDLEPICAEKHQDHWAAVGKNDDGRVDQQSFVSYFMSIGVGNGEDYSNYLNQVFQVGTAMMLPLTKTDLGEHCFTSLMKLPFEFYVDGAAACPDPIQVDEDSENPGVVGAMFLGPDGL